VSRLSASVLATVVVPCLAIGLGLWIGWVITSTIDRWKSL
jgi:hypothetical protein